MYFSPMDTSPSDIITVVSGLPRSGTSLMMKMLQAGAGLETVTDNIRKADEDNPNGYFEDQRVKKLRDDNSWIGEARGKMLKVVSMLLYHLPDDFTYRIVFMQRDLREVLTSQSKMLVRRNENQAADDAQMIKLYRKHLDHVFSYLANRENMTVCRISFNRLFADSKAELETLEKFFGMGLNRDRMITAIDPKLYRRRASV
ncbi:MAG: sulfotransferase domain-containing protein [Desulfobulbaceae bacterium]|nr:sulfotransferase domain-containing protein [Desulfobulbaceae bacterium]